MPMQIVTGQTGTPHVKAAHDGRLHAGLAGSGSYVLKTGDMLAATMQTANSVRISSGDLLMQGRHATIAEGDFEDLVIQNGTQAQKRHDLVVARYEKQSVEPGNESMSLKVIKGEPSDGEASDPEYEEGDILAGDLVAEMPLWRIPLDGISVGDPEPLFDVLMPMDELRESLSQKLLWQGTYTGGQTIEVPGIGDYDVLSFAMSIGFATFPVVCTRFEPGSATFMGCAPFFSSGQVIYLLYVAVTVQGDELSSTAANVSYMRLDPNTWTHGVTTGATITRIVGIL